ncbi:hypothetical protein Tco_1505347 [Tanacetum coccineum]
MDITLTLLPITPLDVQFDTPSPLPPIIGHHIPWNLLEAHGDSDSKPSSKPPNYLVHQANQSEPSNFCPCPLSNGRVEDLQGGFGVGGVGNWVNHVGRMPTKIELTLEQSQQGVSNDVLSPTHYPCDSARTFRVILFSIHNDEWKSFQCHHQTALRSYTLSWKPCQGDSLNLPDHRIHKDGDGDASFQLESDSLPHAHAQTTKTYYKHQDSRIMKAKELKTKTSAQTLIYNIFLQRY